MKRYQIETLQGATGEWTRGFRKGHDHQATSRVNAKALAQTLMVTCAASKRVVDTVTGEVLCTVYTTEEAERRALAATARVEARIAEARQEYRITLHVPNGEDVTTVYVAPAQEPRAFALMAHYRAERKKFTVTLS